MILYHVHILNSATPTYKFESDWCFKDKEKFFLVENNEKKSFIINHVTHDLVKIDGTMKHIVRLNCQPKKAY